MSGLNKFILKIRRKEGNLFIFLNKNIKKIYNFDTPIFKPLFRLLWTINSICLSLTRWLLKTFYYKPVFKSLCDRIGSNLNIVSGMPYLNTNLKLVIGNNVTIYGDAGFQGYKVYEKPILEIGDNTFIGPQVRIGVGKEIKIGKHCLIAARVFISDHDGHPFDWQKRREGLPVEKTDIKPIVIEDDVWIGEGAFICKGVKIGRGAIVGARAVVTKDIANFTVVAGNPARVIKIINDGIDTGISQQI